MLINFFACAAARIIIKFKKLPVWCECESFFGPNWPTTPTVFSATCLLSTVSEHQQHPAKWILSGSWTSSGLYNRRCNFRTYCPIIYRATLANVRASMGHRRPLVHRILQPFTKLQARSRSMTVLPTTNYWRT